MTTLSKDEIIAMARKVGAVARVVGLSILPKIVFGGTDQLAAFAHLCRADLVAENDALKADAERYRWLRDNDSFANPSADLAHVFSRYADSYLDGHIDALMK